MDILVPRKTINPAALAAEMTAAIGPAWQGWSARASDVTNYVLHVPDATPQATIDAAIAVYNAHNPAVLTPAQQLAARREVAKGDVSAADFVAVLNQINAATSLADAKPILKKLLALTYRVALAQGLTDAADPGA
jgi:hypothetical protein